MSLEDSYFFLDLRLVMSLDSFRCLSRPLLAVAVVRFRNGGGIGAGTSFLAASSERRFDHFSLGFLDRCRLGVESLNSCGFRRFFNSFPAVTELRLDLFFPVLWRVGRLFRSVDGKFLVHSLLFPPSSCLNHAANWLPME